MALGRKRVEEAPQEKVLEVDASMQGSLSFKDPVNLRISGNFEGTLDTKGTLAIGERADVKATIQGEVIIIAGTINGGITAFDPDGTTEHYPFPDLLCTNICFGGPDMTTAWVTASGTGKLYKAKWPRPGLKLNFNA